MEQKLTTNKLLRLLPPTEMARLEPLLQRKHIALRESIYESNKPIEYIFFVESGVLSLLATTGPGVMVEVATVGNEGFVGVPVLHGAKRIPGLAFCQIAGDSCLLQATLLLELVAELPTFRLMLNRYAETLFNQIAQNAACNRSHNVYERCARWLLLTHDRMEGHSFPLTQEFLGQMLGVRRPAVNAAAGALQKEGVITYTRGIITVTDRPALERASCECYGIVAEAFRQLLGPEFA